VTGFAKCGSRSGPTVTTNTSEDGNTSVSEQTVLVSTQRIPRNETARTQGAHVSTNSAMRASAKATLIESGRSGERR